MTLERMAQCTYCKVERPSAESESLAFFQDRGPGFCNDTCKVCRYYEVAHYPNASRVNPEVPKQCQHSFEPMIEGYPFDSFYCGCRGWD